MPDIIQAEPDFRFEDEYSGLVCGLDEAGRAPLAGPVTAACVYIPADARHVDFIDSIKDSKRIAKKKRQTLYELIQQHFSFGIAHVWQNEIDDINIHHASLLAMKRAFETMCNDFNLRIEHALIDGKFRADLPCPSTPLIKGDNRSKSIAAASILAKVCRDNYMADLHESYPHYNWIKNSGYPTREHLDAVDKYGITDHHRQSFAPIRKYAQAV